MLLLLTSQTKLTLTVTLTLTDTVMLTSWWEIIYAPKLEDYLLFFYNQPHFLKLLHVRPVFQK